MFKFLSVYTDLLFHEFIILIREWCVSFCMHLMRERMYTRAICHYNHFIRMDGIKWSNYRTVYQKFIYFFFRKNFNFPLGQLLSHKRPSSPYELHFDSIFVTRCTMYNLYMLYKEANIYKWNCGNKVDLGMFSAVFFPVNFIIPVEATTQIFNDKI